MKSRTEIFGGLITVTAAAIVVCCAGCSGGGAGSNLTMPEPAPASANDSVANAAATVPSYTFTVFDGPGGAPTTVNGISNLGTSVGFTTHGGKNANFLRTAAGALTALNLGDPAAGMANGVNRIKTVVGVANGVAVVLSDGKLTKLLLPHASSSVALGVNDSGVIVGQYVNADAKTPGFVDVKGVFTSIVPTATAKVTNVQGVNNFGNAVGFYSADGVHQHGFLYHVASKTSILLADPSTARTKADGLVLTQFLGINDHNEAVGYYQTKNGSQFGFLYNLGTRAYTFLDAPKAVPVKGVQITQITGIDNDGVIAGFYIASDGDQHGFVAVKTSH